MLRVTLKKLHELPTKTAVRPRQSAATPHQNDKDSVAYLKKLTIHHEDFRKPDDYSHTFPKDFQGNLGSPIKVNKPPRHDVEVIANQSDKLLDEKVSDYFNVSNIIKMEDMVNAKMHFGHDSNRRHHAMNKYIFGSRYGMDIIDLDQTLPRFIGAMSVLAHSIYREGRVMLICENPKYWKLVNNLSVKCGFYNLNQYDFESLTHKLRWLNSHISGEKMPDVCIFLGVNNMNGLAQTELLDYCNRSYGLSIGFVDSDVNPTACTYRIPANDDSKESIEYYCKIIEEVYNVATQKKNEHDQASLKASLVNSLTDGENNSQSSDKVNLIEADEAVENIEKYESMGTMSADYGGKNMEMPNVPEAGKEEKPLTVKEKMKKRKIKIIKAKKKFFFLQINMAERRRLQQEVEKTIKKIDEGISLFQTTLAKFKTTTNPSQREKLNEDLKKEIKKLQRYRDQVKSWQGNDQVKDKDKLKQARLMIEHEMETFKNVERENKNHGKGYGMRGENNNTFAMLDADERERLEMKEKIAKVVQRLREKRENADQDILSLRCGRDVTRREYSANNRDSDLDSDDDTGNKSSKSKAQSNKERRKKKKEKRSQSVKSKDKDGKATDNGTGNNNEKAPSPTDMKPIEDLDEDAKDKVETLDHIKDRCGFHITNLHVLNRMLDNGSMTSDQIVEADLMEQVDEFIFKANLDNETYDVANNDYLFDDLVDQTLVAEMTEGSQAAVAQINASIVPDSITGNLNLADNISLSSQSATIPDTPTSSNFSNNQSQPFVNQNTNINNVPQVTKDLNTYPTTNSNTITSTTAIKESNKESTLPLLDQNPGQTQLPPVGLTGPQSSNDPANTLNLSTANSNKNLTPIYNNMNMSNSAEMSKENEMVDEMANILQPSVSNISGPPPGVPVKSSGFPAQNVVDNNRNSPTVSNLNSGRLVNSNQVGGYGNNNNNNNLNSPVELKNNNLPPMQLRDQDLRNNSPIHNNNNENSQYINQPPPVMTSPGQILRNNNSNNNNNQPQGIVPGSLNQNYPPLNPANANNNSVPIQNREMASSPYRMQEKNAWMNKSRPGAGNNGLNRNFKDLSINEQRGHFYDNYSVKVEVQPENGLSTVYIPKKLVWVWGIFFY